MENLPATNSNRLSILNRELSALTDHLKPATEDAVASRMLQLRASGLDWPNGIDPVRAPKIYAFALGAVSVEALKHVCMRIIQGGYPEHTRFIPRPPELAALVRKETAPMIEDAARLRAIAEAMTPSAETSDPEEQQRQLARVRQIHQDYKGHQAKLKAEEAARRPLMTEETANAYFRNKIQPAEEPRAAKWDDEAWYKQQEEIGNDKEAGFGPEGDDQGGVRGRSEGQRERLEGGEGVRGSEDGGE